MMHSEQKPLSLSFSDDFKNSMTLKHGTDSAVYTLEGGLELSFNAEEKEAFRTGTVETLNLTAEKCFCSAHGLPDLIHLSLAEDAETTVYLDEKRGTGKISANVEVDDDLPWPELEILPASEDNLKLIKHTQLTIHLSRIDDEWRAIGHSLPFPLHPEEFIPGEFIFDGYMEIDSGIKCCEMCLRIWSPGGVISKAQAQRILNKVNSIWGCSTGQCCLNMKMKRYSANTIMPQEILLRNGKIQDHANIIGNFRRDFGHRSKKCLDLYFIKKIASNAGPQPTFDTLGVTARGPKIIGAIASTEGADGKAFSEDFQAMIAAHELGHAMGIRRHSTVDGNLMKPAGDPRWTPAQIRENSKLSEAQCKRARESRFHRMTKEGCELNPRERTA